MPGWSVRLRHLPCRGMSASESGGAGLRGRPGASVWRLVRCRRVRGAHADGPPLSGSTAHCRTNRHRAEWGRLAPSRERSLIPGRDAPSGAAKLPRTGIGQRRGFDKTRPEGYPFLQMRINRKD